MNLIETSDQKTYKEVIKNFAKERKTYQISGHVYVSYLPGSVLKKSIPELEGEWIALVTYVTKIMVGFPDLVEPEFILYEKNGEWRRVEPWLYFDECLHRSSRSFEIGAYLHCPIDTFAKEKRTKDELLQAQLNKKHIEKLEAEKQKNLILNEIRALLEILASEPRWQITFPDYTIKIGDFTFRVYHSVFSENFIAIQQKASSVLLGIAIAQGLQINLLAIEKYPLLAVLKLIVTDSVTSPAKTFNQN